MFFFYLNLPTAPNEGQGMKLIFYFIVTSQQIILAGTNVGGFIFNFSEPISYGNFVLLNFAIGKRYRTFEVGKSRFVKEFGKSCGGYNFLLKRRYRCQKSQCFLSDQSRHFFSASKSPRVFFTERSSALRESIIPSDL